MGAVAAGLIGATGIKLLAGLRNNALGRKLCFALTALACLSVALLHLPLVMILALLGLPAMAWAWHELRP